MDRKYQKSIPHFLGMNYNKDRFCMNKDKEGLSITEFNKTDLQHTWGIKYNI